MKFLAVLKDSFREAIDTKVFYVMVALSLLVGLFTLTMKFTPKTGDEARGMLHLATLPLSVDNIADLEFRNPERMLEQMKKNTKGVYEFVSSEPIGDEKGGPQTPFRVVVRAMSVQEGKQLDPAETIAHIQERFGKLDDVRLMEAAEVRQIDKPDGAEARAPGEKFYEITTRPTPVTVRLWPHTWGLFFGNWNPAGDAALPLGMQLFLIEQVMVGWVGASITILVSIVITAFFIPNMLRKGTVDLLIVKPVHRPVLLLYKYIGGLTFIFLNTLVAVFVVWVALGIRSGIWSPAIFYMVPVITFSFAILYSLSTLAAVLTRSAIVAILVTCFAWGVLWVFSMVYTFVEARKTMEEKQDIPQENRIDPTFARVVNAIHFILPRRDDLDTLTTRVLVRDLLTANQLKAEKLDKESKTSWGESLTVSCLYVVLFLGLSCWWFATKDY